LALSVRGDKEAKIYSDRLQDGRYRNGGKMKKTTQGKVEPPDPWPSKSLRSQLRDWLKEICPKQNLEDYCQIMADSATPEVMKIRVFTHDYRYSIFATESADQPEELHKALLSCEATRRKSLAGLTEHRYARLVDGPFTRVTWELIKTTILRFELVKLTAKAKDDQWRNMSSHFESHGKQYYEEWLQKGGEISEHKTYELVGEKQYGVASDPESTDAAKK